MTLVVIVGIFVLGFACGFWLCHYLDQAEGEDEP